MKIAVLGAGLVGGPIAADLARDREFDVRAVDIDPRALAKLRERFGVETLETDLSGAEEVRKAVAGCDFAISAVPGFMGFRTLEALIEAKRNVVDIAFFAEDPFLLDEAARLAGVTAIVDCGVAPGMSNVLAGHIDSQFDETRRLEIYVGGLPEIREWPFEYRAVFSPADVLEEYLRPARLVENGAVVTRTALSERELIDFPGIGTLEAFNTDGLRTLLRTMKAPNMKEKTLRYRGHAETMAVLRHAGFFDRDEVEVKGARVRPFDLTARLLFAKWSMTEDDRDITVFRLIAEGVKDGVPVRCTYDMLDRYDPGARIHSMARTTGYTATQAIRLMACGLFRRPGVNPPEFIGREAQCVDFMLRGLRERGIVYTQTLERPAG